MFDSCVVAEAIGTGFEADGVDSVVEVEMRSTAQPLPDKVGIIHGKYLLGSNESQLIYLTRASGYRLISMEVLGRVCSEDAKSSKVRDAELVAASVPFVV